MQTAVLGRVNATLDGIAWLGGLASVLFIVFSPLPRLRSAEEIGAGSWSDVAHRAPPT